MLVDSDNHLWIVDRDEAVLAPRERDLMFVVGGIGHGLVRPHDTERFLQEGLMDLFEPGNIVDLANRFAGRFGPG